MATCKLGVEVMSAHDLMPEDGQGSCSACVELEFDGQCFCTATKEKDLNPVWNERFYLDVSDPTNLPELALEAYVYNVSKSVEASRSFLGKVTIAGTSFVPFKDSVVMHYPLEKRGVLSRVQGELGLKVYITNGPSIIGASNTTSPPTPTHAEQKIAAGDVTGTNNLNSSQEHNRQPSKSMYAGAEQMKSEQPKMVSAASQQPMEYALKEISPLLGGGKVVRGRFIRSEKHGTDSNYDLVERVQYLFVRVVKARDLPSMDITGNLHPFVEVRVGNYRGKTEHIDNQKNPKWNAIFAFSIDRMQASVLEMVVKNKDILMDDFVGMVRIHFNDVPVRAPADSPLAPEWYRLGNKHGDKSRSELMLAVWIGTQADEAFPDAWHSDAAIHYYPSAVTHMKPTVYHAPRLWYLRVNVIEAQDIDIHDKTRHPDVFVRATVGHQQHKTKPVQAVVDINPFWNEDLMFVAAEPFEDYLILTLEDRVAPEEEEVLGRIIIPLTTIGRRADDRIVQGKWFDLQQPDYYVDQLKKDKFSYRLHLRLCLDGGYHVLDESTNYSGDFRPAAKQLWKPSIGLLELGVLGAQGIAPMKSRDDKGTADVYCVAKYGSKWIRTRTIINNRNPKFNEQYSWEVYDPSTVLTIGAFDNAHGGNDAKIGKVRIRLSALETGRIYTHSYPLLVLHPSGVKKMGELQLAIRFSSTSLVNMLYMYSQPLLPKMHYARPIPVLQSDPMRHQAVQIVAARLSRMEPPLRKEVVEYMSDFDSRYWSMRQSKANLFRLMSVFSGLFAVSKCFSAVCAWKNPVASVLMHILFIVMVCFPELILPTVSLCTLLIVIWNYRYRPDYPPHMNTKISCVEDVNPNELDEEFDTFPTSRNQDTVRMSYDNMRSVAGKIQTVVGDIATRGERMQALVSWRDPRATSIFALLCFIATMVLYVTPLQVLVALAGFYAMRHPWFRHRLPSTTTNFFRRLPARTDSML